MKERRQTPSMSLLTAFESAARHLSFTRAAEELFLTQSAVSRQVQALEELINVDLFHRSGRKIRLTDAGAMYASEIGASLERIRVATQRASSYRTGGSSLHIAILPAVATKWLIPRLPSFNTAHPQIHVNVHSRIGQFDMEEAGMDAAISNSADGHWPNALAEKLWREELVPIISPELARQAPMDGPSAICQYQLLHVAARPNVWKDWFNDHDIPVNRMKLGPTFELSYHMVQAVAAGMGVGLIGRFLVEDDLRSGNIVIAGPPDMLPYRGLSYYLFTPRHRAGYEPLRLFRAWLIGASDAIRPDDAPY